LRVVVAEMLAVAADPVLVANHLRILVAHLVTALVRLQVHNLARKNSVEAESARGTKGGEKRRFVRNYMFQFGTVNKKCRLRTREYLEREN
jgi:hypothetical protein